MVAPPLWTAAEAAAATGGTAIGDWAATGVSIDSRTLRPGDLFVALTDARDGHDFVAEALATGAAAAMVARIPEGVAPDAPLLIVPDVLDALGALGALGAAGRARSRATVIGVTGSVGKTSAKEMLRVMLAGQGRVHAAEASHNNHWGVPLTLARLPADADFAIVEMGMNHPGEIAPLARLTRPEVALITAIAPAHLEAMGSLDAIAREKAAILDAVPPGGTAVLPGGHATTPILTERAAAASLRTVLFAEGGPADYHLDRVTQCGAQMVVEATAPAGAVLFRLDGAGRHFALGALGALAAAEAAGADLARAALALRGWRPPAGRGTRERIVLDSVEEAAFDLIDDAFNANPASLGAALDMLAATAPGETGPAPAPDRHTAARAGPRPGRRIAILGDMLELGADAAEMHRALARHPAIGHLDTVHCVGPLMRHLWAALEPRRRGRWEETAEALGARAHRLVRAGDIVLIKGSKSSRVARVVDALRDLGQADADDPRERD